LKDRVGCKFISIEKGGIVVKDQPLTQEAQIKKATSDQFKNTTFLTVFKPEIQDEKGFARSEIFRASIKVRTTFWRIDGELIGPEKTVGVKSYALSNSVLFLFCPY
jgi:hypothetical protein